MGVRKTQGVSIVKDLTVPRGWNRAKKIRIFTGPGRSGRKTIMAGDKDNRAGDQIIPSGEDRPRDYNNHTHFREQNVPRDLTSPGEIGQFQRTRTISGGKNNPEELTDPGVRTVPGVKGE